MNQRLAAVLTAGLAAGFLACEGSAGTSADVVAADAWADAAGDVPGELAGDLPGADARGDAFPVPAAGHCEPNEDPLPEPFEPPVPATLPFLHVDGTRLVDEAGHDVALRGVNLGAWLQIEAWIPGLGTMDGAAIVAGLQAQADGLGLGDLLREARAQNEGEWVLELKSRWTCVQEWRAWMYQGTDPDQQELVDVLWAWFDDQPWVEEEEGLWRWVTRRFGEDRAGELRTLYRDRWATEQDVARAAALGLNVLRVPFWYRALETDRPGESHFDPGGWKRLDDLVTWARKHAMYLVLDLHGAPGGQSTAGHQGLQDGGRLWTEPKCQAKAARLWKAVASRYGAEPHVAILDLLNEPMSFTSAQQYRDVHDALYRAIREVDERHVVMCEDGYKSPGMLVSPREMGWENAMFSIHLYPKDAATAAAYAASIEESVTTLEARFDWSTRFACPLFLGEFNTAATGGAETWGAEGMSLALDALNRHGVHWAPWTWKSASGRNTWGVLHPKGDGDGRRLDLSGTFEDVRAGLDAMDSSNYEDHADYAAALKLRAGEGFAAQDLQPPGATARPSR